MRGWHSGDAEKRESTEDREGARKSSGMNQLMRFAVAETDEEIAQSYRFYIIQENCTLFCVQSFL